MTNELDWMRRQILILGSGLIIALVILWLILPNKSLVAGFILGCAISIYNILYLARKVRMTGEVIANGTRSVMGTGFFNRILMVAFGVILVVKFPESIDYRSLILGLPVSYILMVFIAVFYTKKDRINREGRDVHGTDSKN